jgi:hypothetical protein
MQDWIYLLIAFILGFFVKHLLGTVCRSRLIEGSLVAEVADAPVDKVLDPNSGGDVETGSVCTNNADCKSGYCGDGPTCLTAHNFGNGLTTCIKVGYKCKGNPWV